MDTLDEALRVIRSMNEAGVDYVVIGGVALNIHGLVRATEDLDIFVRPDEENSSRRSDSGIATSPSTCSRCVTASRSGSCQSATVPWPPCWAKNTDSGVRNGSQLPPSGPASSDPPSSFAFGPASTPDPAGVAEASRKPPSPWFPVVRSPVGEEDIRRRFDDSRRNLVGLLSRLEELKVYDKSATVPVHRGVPPAPMLVLHLRSGRIVGPRSLRDTPPWAKPIVAQAIKAQG